jgi:hypothetical protein
METNVRNETLSLSIYDVLTITLKQKKIFFIVSAFIFLLGAIVSFSIVPERMVTKTIVIEVPSGLTIGNVLPWFVQNISLPENFIEPSISYSVPTNSFPLFACSYKIKGKFDLKENDKFWNQDLLPLYQKACLYGLLIDNVKMGISQNTALYRNQIESLQIKLKKYQEYRAEKGNTPGLPLVEGLDSRLSWISPDIVISYLERQIIELEIQSINFNKNVLTMRAYQPLIMAFENPSLVDLPSFSSSVSNIADREIRESTLEKAAIILSPITKNFYRPEKTDVKFVTMPLWRQLFFSLILATFLGLVAAFIYGYFPRLMKAIKPK